MALSESIDDDAFESAHRLALSSTPKYLLEAEFIVVFTRHLVSELSRAGVEEVKNDRERSTLKIRQALESIKRSKADQWTLFLTNRTALRMALEHELAARTTFSEMPESIRRLTERVSVAPPAYSPASEMPTKRSGLFPPVNDPQELKRNC